MCLFVLKIHTATIKSSNWLFDYFLLNLVFFNKHNWQMNTMVWQGSGILAPWDDIKWRKRKVILHKSCPIGNGGSTPPIITKHCGVEQLVARQAQDRVTHCEEFTELAFGLAIHLIMKWVRLSYSVLTWRSWVRVPPPLQKKYKIFS